MNGLIYTGGDWPDLATAKMLSERADVSICCDGAAEEAYRYGLPFQTLVGDMDSIRPDLLEDYQIRRNKNIIYVMVVIDVALYGIFCKTNIAMAHSEMMFIILVALTLLAGVMKNKRIK